MSGKLVMLDGYYIEYNTFKCYIQAYSESSRIKTYNIDEASVILLTAEVKAHQDNIKYSEAIARLVIDDLQNTAGAGSA